MNTKRLSRTKQRWLCALCLVLPGLGRAATKALCDAADKEAPARRVFGTPEPGAAATRCVAFSPDGKMLAGGGAITVKLWDVASGRLLREIEPDMSTYSLAFSPDGRTLATSGHGGVQLWTVTTGKLLRTLEKENRFPSVAFSPDGTMVAAGGADYMKLWSMKPVDGQNGAPDEGSILMEGMIAGVAFSPDSKRLAAITNWSRITLHDTQTKKLLWTQQALIEKNAQGYIVGFNVDAPHGPRGPLLTFLLGGKVLANANPNRPVELRTVRSGALLRTLSDPGGYTRTIAASPNGRMLATNAIKLWNAQTGELIKALNDDAYSVAFSPDGKTLAAATAYETVELWQVP